MRRVLIFTTLIFLMFNCRLIHYFEEEKDPDVVSDNRLENLPPTLTNQTDTDIIVTGTNAVEYQYSLDGSPYTSAIDINVNLSITGLSEGVHTLNVLVRDDGGKWPSDTDALVFVWEIDLTPPVVTLANLPPSPTNMDSVNISIAGGDVEFYKYSIDGGVYSASGISVGTPIALSGLAEGTHIIDVIGVDAAGNWQSKATPTSFTWDVDFSATPTAMINITTGGVSIPYGGSYDFGNIEGFTSSTIVYFDIENSGNADLNISSITIDNTDDFTLSNSTTVVSQGGGTGSFDMIFHPKKYGAIGATVTIVSDGSINPYTFTVQGYGIEIIAMVDVQQGVTPIPSGTGSFDFGNVNEMTSSSAIAFEVINDGSADLNISSLTMDNTTDFYFNSSISFVAQGTSDSFEIVFNPQSQGIKSSVITMLSDGNIPSYTFTVGGTGLPTSPILSVNQGGTSLSSGTGIFTYATIDSLSISPVTSFTMDNTGNADLNITSITIDNTTDFYLSSYPTLISQSTSDSFDIIFQPQSDGYKSVTVTIISDDVSSPYTFTVEGTANPLIANVGIQEGATPIPDGGSYDFGNQNESSSTPFISFVINNTGNAYLNISSITIDNTVDFTIQNIPGFVMDGGSDSFELSFYPKSPGSKSATVTMISDGDINPFTFTIEGTANPLAPEIVVTDITSTSVNIESGNTMYFGAAGLNSTLTRTIEFSNTGNTDLNITGWGFSGGEFETNPLSGSILVTTSTPQTININFTPTIAGSVLESITFYTDDPDESNFVINLDAAGDFTSSEMYVSASSGDDASNDGSKSLPFRTINKAISMASVYGVSEIRVEEGTYIEQVVIDSGTGNVQLYGGYMTGFTLRDPQTYPSIISYDIDQGVLISDLAIDNTTIVDGFEIRADDLDSQSVGVMIRNSSSPIVENNIIHGRYSTGSSSNVYAVHISGASTPLVQRNILYGGESGNSPIAIYVNSVGTNPVINANEIYHGNASLYSHAIGYYNGAAGVFKNNYCYGGGAGTDYAIRMYGTSSPSILNNTIIVGNPSGGSGSVAFHLNNDSDPVIKNNIIARVTGSSTNIKLFDVGGHNIYTDSNLNTMAFENNVFFDFASTPANIINDKGNFEMDVYMYFNNPISNDYSLTSSTTTLITEGGLDLSGAGVVIDNYGSSRTVPYCIGAHEQETGVAPSWQQVGDSEFASGEVYSMVIDFYDDGTPVVAYSTNTSQVEFARFNGSSWDVYIVGTSGALLIFTSQVAVAVHNNDPYVGYINSSTGYFEVRKFNGSGFDAPHEFTLSSANGYPFPTMAVANSKLYVGFIDSVSNISIYEYDGAAWSAETGANSWLHSTFTSGRYLKLASDGIDLYCLYEDDNNRAHVRQFSGASWIDKGEVTTALDHFGEDIGFDVYNGLPYFGFKNTSSSSHLFVWKFDGGSWSDFTGSNGVYSTQVDIDVVSESKIYAAFQRSTAGQNTVARFDGSSWNDVGSYLGSSATSRYITIKSDPNGVVYVVRRFDSTGNNIVVEVFQ